MRRALGPARRETVALAAQVAFLWAIVTGAVFEVFDVARNGVTTGDLAGYGVAVAILVAIFRYRRYHRDHGT